MMTRMNTYRYDYRSVDEYVKAHLQPGDIVFPGIPHVYEFYTGMSGDYFLNTLLGSKVPYNQLLEEPRFVDKFAGLPVVRNLTELKEAVNRGKRTWLIFAPYASFEKLSSPESPGVSRCEFPRRLRDLSREGPADRRTESDV